MSGASPPAARFHDPVAHSHALGGFLAGALVGIAEAAAVAVVVGIVATAVAAEVASAGLATPLVAGVLVTVGELVVNASVGGALMNSAEETGEQIGSQSMGSPSGAIAQGSPNVFVNGLFAARVTDAESCDAGKIAQGSATVFINGLQAARVGDKTTCGATIVKGSPNVYIGGPTKTVLPVQSEVPQWARWAAIVAGLLPALGGLARAIGPALAEIEATGFARAMQTGVKALGRAMEERAGGVRAPEDVPAYPPEVVADADRLGIPPAKVQQILDTPKPDRPPPADYVSPQRMSEHADAFADGGSRIVLQDNLDKYGIGQRDGTTFISTKADTDQMLADAGGDPRKLEDALGLPAGQLDNSQLVRLDFTPQSMSDLDMRMPSGNEAGANSQWLPGGYLPNGQNEAVINGAGAQPQHYTKSIINP